VSPPPTHPPPPPPTWIDRRIDTLRATGRFRGLVPLCRHHSDRYSAKAWVLPDGTGLSLDRWHFEWILANQPIGESFGIDFTTLPRDEEFVRIAAVKAGFFRVNYEYRNSLLTIEGLASRLDTPVREALELILLESLDALGGVTIHRFDAAVTSFEACGDRGLGLLSSRSERLEAIGRLLDLPGLAEARGAHPAPARNHDSDRT